MQQRGVRTNNRCPCLLKVIALKTKPGLNPKSDENLVCLRNILQHDLWKQENPVASPLSGNTWWGHCPALKCAEFHGDGSHHFHTTYMLWLRSVPRAMMVFDGKNTLLLGWAGKVMDLGYKEWVEGSCVVQSSSIQKIFLEDLLCVKNCVGWWR